MKAGLVFIWDFLTNLFDSFNDLVGPGFWDTLFSLAIIVGVYLGSRVVRNRVRGYTRKRFGADNSFSDLIDNIVRVVLFVVMAIMVFAAFGVDSASLVTFLGFTTAAIALSLQDVLRNIFCGLYLLAEQPFRAGDRIRLMSEEGWVERIDLRVTRIRNDRQELVMVPNQTVFSQVVSNRSTRRSRPFTVEINNIKMSIEESDAKTREVFEALPEQASDPIIRLVQSGPDGVNLEITCRRTSSEDHQGKIARALIESFPGATLKVVAR